MFESLKNVFGKKPDPAAWQEEKSRLMVAMLGKEHDMVMHALIPYATGGGLDLYYYPHGIPGTAIATKELSELPGQGSSNVAFKCYEFVMFTRHSLDLDLAHDDSSPFGKAHATINSILNCIGPYSATATLNPCETCEFPQDMAKIGGKCILFDAYGVEPSPKTARFGVMVAIEVFRSEIGYARSNGGQELIDLLKEAGHYPYSDLEREPVA